ncbi:MAG TPA: ABC transporter ATP-binding protein [Rhizomicrobium sp.]|jgi:lipopolysaccharide transport system ATP-binding protein
MSSSDIVVSVRGLSKSYTIEHKAREAGTAAEALVRFLANPFRSATKEEVWSLRDVSFDIRKGEIVGVIGRNGAGKSTLLKVLSRITEPTRGEARIAGRVGSLIEVGTGFQPELTGRENIFLNGAILGMRKTEIARRFDQIVDFSGVEKYLDTPVKRYSSGMYVRLAFAVAAHLDTDILFVDEVLSVGDTEFQNKCLGRLSDVAEEGRTVMFVGHNMATLESLCTHGILLDKGRMLHAGPLKETISEYQRMIRPDHVPEAGVEAGPIDYGSRYEHVRGADMVDTSGRSTRRISVGEKLTVQVTLDLPQALDGAVFVVWVDNSFGQCILTLKTPRTGAAANRLHGRCELTCEVDSIPLMPGEYMLNFGLWKGAGYIDLVDGNITFVVQNQDAFGDGWGAHSTGVCVAPSRWQVRNRAQQNAEVA